MHSGLPADSAHQGAFPSFLARYSILGRGYFRSLGLRSLKRAEKRQGTPASTSLRAMYTTAISRSDIGKNRSSAIHKAIRYIMAISQVVKWSDGRNTSVHFLRKPYLTGLPDTTPLKHHYSKNLLFRPFGLIRQDTHLARVSCMSLMSCRSSSLYCVVSTRCNIAFRQRAE